MSRRTGAHVKSLGCPFWHSYQHQARQENCFDVLAHSNGRILESSLANVFFVTGRGTITPPADGSILPGIARQQLLKDKELGINQRPMPLTSLQSVDAIFISNSVRGVIPINRIVHPRGALVWWGDVGQVRPFKKAWQRLIRAQTRQT
jgi:branched-subunit amino acid aminotransferase/4-amino-4-deoxychorismate lyase